MRHFLFTGLLSVSVALSALFPVNALSAGDPVEGEIKGYTCTGCHGIPGYKNVYPTYSVPKIGGQNAEYIEIALKAYRSGERQHSPMSLHAEGLTDQDIADIAAWLATVGEEE